MPVAGENLVAAVAVQNHADVFCRHPGDREGGQGGCIGERLVVMADDPFHIGDVRFEDEVPMVGAVLVCDQLRQRAFVEALVGEPDRKRFQGPVHFPGGEGADQAGIDSARQETAQRHVAAEADTDRIAQRFLDQIDGIVEPDIALFSKGRRPVGFAGQRPGCRNRHHGRRGDAMNTAIDRRFAGHDAEGQIVVHRLFVHRKVDARQAEQCFHLRREDDPAIGRGIEKGLLSGAESLRNVWPRARRSSRSAR